MIYLIYKVKGEINMNEVKQLELLSESVRNEIDELQSLLDNSDNFLLKSKKSLFQKQLKNIISNLESVNGSIYGVFEELNTEYNDDMLNAHNVMIEVLQERLSYDEKIDMRIKHNIHL